MTTGDGEDEENGEGKDKEMDYSANEYKGRKAAKCFSSSDERNYDDNDEDVSHPGPSGLHVSIYILS